MKIKLEGIDKIKFMERKRRSIDQLAVDFGELSKTMYPSQELFMRLKNEIKKQERLHNLISKEFIKYEQAFHDNFNVKKFAEVHGVTYEHIKRCYNGTRSYSPMLQDAIVQWVKMGAKKTNT